jgi:hypothetical protein
MVILIVSLVSACVVMRNFGKGLREQRQRAKARKRWQAVTGGGKSARRQMPVNQHELDAVRKRMTLE